MNNILDISRSGVALNANIINSGNVQIEEFGFVLDNESKQTTNYRKSVEGINENIEQFQFKDKTILNNSETNEVYEFYPQ